MSGLLRFAAIMGPLSSLFDFLTFGALVFLFNASPEEFRTGPTSRSRHRRWRHCWPRWRYRSRPWAPGSVS
jgi:hypothetical protein